MEELKDMIATSTKGIEDLKRAKGLQGVTKSDKVTFLKGRITRAKQALRSMKGELREMPKLQVCLDALNIMGTNFYPISLDHILKRQINWRRR